MKVLLNIIVVAAFCTCALGGAGLNKVAPDQRWRLAGLEMSYPKPPVLTLAAGLLALGIAGAAQRRWRPKSKASADEGRPLDSFLQSLHQVRDAVAELEHNKNAMDAADLAERIDRLLAGEYFDLTSRHEELAALIGFSRYASVWEGVAKAERRLARVWSMTVDGHCEESVGELAVALSLLEASCRRLNELAGQAEQ